MSEPDDPFDVIDDEIPSAAGRADEEFKIDKFRIDYFIALRRGAIRSRSWWLVAFFLACIFSLDMLLKAFSQWWETHTLVWPILRVAAVIPAVFLASHARSRVRDFSDEINQSALPEPTTPPDFSTLGNGEDRWKNLEHVE